MPKAATVDTNTIDALKLLTDAVTPLAKSVADDLADAILQHQNAVKYDLNYDNLIKAAGKIPPQFMKKKPAAAKADADSPKSDADTGEDGGTAKENPGETAGEEAAAADESTTAADGKADNDAEDEEAAEENADAAKAVAVFDLAKASHEVVDAYLLAADDQVAKAEGKESPWLAFAKTVNDYHTARAAHFAKAAEDAGKLADTTTVTAALAKADNEETKKSITATAEAYGRYSQDLLGKSEDFKTLASHAVYPQPTVTLAKALTMPDGSLSITDKTTLHKAMQSYKSLSNLQQPPAYAHIMDAAKALNAIPPVGWHHPVTLPGDPQPTAKVTDISASAKSAAMAKGVLVVGPLANMLAQIETLRRGTRVFGETSMLKSEMGKSLSDWLEVGEDMLKGMIVTEAQDIAILDIPTFPEPITKADHWATITGKVLLDTCTDDMAKTDKDFIVELAGRFDEAGKELIAKSVTGGDGGGLAKMDTVIAGLRDDLVKAQAEAETAKANLDKFNKQVVPLARGAAKLKEDLTKSVAENTDLKTQIAKLQAEPVPAKGRTGNVTGIRKGEGETEDGTGTAAAEMKKVDALPTGTERANSLFDAARLMRAEEMIKAGKRRERR